MNGTDLPHPECDIWDPLLPDLRHFCTEGAESTHTKPLQSSHALRIHLEAGNIIGTYDGQAQR